MRQHVRLSADPDQRHRRLVAGSDLAAVHAPSSVRCAGNLVHVTIDSRNNCLANRFTPSQYREEAIYPKGSVPKETCRVKGDAARVPDIVGFPVEDAIRILRDEGFGVQRVSTPNSTYPPGIVVGQDPLGGTKAPKGSTILIEVSVKPKEKQPETGEVPNVLGYTRQQAEAILHDRGYEVATIVQKESNRKQARKRAGQVWKQSPAGGTQYEKGKTVTIWVNPG
jgi:hypothetical protein